MNLKTLSWSEKWVACKKKNTSFWKGNKHQTMDRFLKPDFNRNWYYISTVFSTLLIFYLELHRRIKKKCYIYRKKPDIYFLCERTSLSPFRHCDVICMTYFALFGYQFLSLRNKVFRSFQKLSIVEI